MKIPISENTESKRLPQKKRIEKIGTKVTPKDLKIVKVRNLSFENMMDIFKTCEIKPCVYYPDSGCLQSVSIN